MGSTAYSEPHTLAMLPNAVFRLLLKKKEYPTVVTDELLVGVLEILAKIRTYCVSPIAQRGQTTEVIAFAAKIADLIDALEQACLANFNLPDEESIARIRHNDNRAYLGYMIHQIMKGRVETFSITDLETDTRDFLGEVTKFFKWPAQADRQQRLAETSSGVSRKFLAPPDRPHSGAFFVCEREKRPT